MLRAISLGKKAGVFYNSNLKILIEGGIINAAIN